MAKISWQDAARAVLERRGLRNNLAEWCRYAGFEPAAHHQLLIKELEAVTRGETDRLLVCMPPGAAKSTYASILFPCWYLGSNPDHCLIAASHTQELGEKWGRRVRNLIAEHATILGVGLSPDSQAAGRWETDRDGEYFAAGVGGAIAGRRADLVVIDDPVRSREDADSELVREKTWDWYKSDLYTRLKPGGRIILIQCMVGETPVLMADGTERELRHIRRGDAVATWDNGKLSTSEVLNWKSNGLDKVFTIKMTSGNSVKANARHPFLVCRDGVPTWIRVRDLRPGHKMFRVNGESGRAKLASLTGAINLSRHADIAYHTTVKSDGQTAFARHQQALLTSIKRISSIVTGLVSRITTEYSRSSMASALSAFAPILGRRGAGAGSSYPTIATTQGSFAHSFATPATWLLDTPTLQRTHKPLPTISDFTTDQIVEIAGAGVEEVFDVQINQTENFIAGLYVSHNTRWHEDDLAGRLLEDMGKGGDQWRVISLPAVAETDTDPLGRKQGEALWPEWEGLTDLDRKRRAVGPREWSALYQQRPAPEDGDFFKAEWFRPYDKAPARDVLRVYGGSDYAVTSDGGDFTVHVVVGLDPEGRMYLLDVWRKQASSESWVESFCDLVLAWKPIGWAEEGGQIRSGVGPYLDRRQRERKAYCARETFPTRGDKAVRAQSIRGRMALEGLYVPEKASWWPVVRGELLSFPAGRHDDTIDALGLVGQLLDHMLVGVAPTKAAKPGKVDDYVIWQPKAEPGDWLGW